MDSDRATCSNCICIQGQCVICHLQMIKHEFIYVRREAKLVRGKLMKTQKVKRNQKAFSLNNLVTDKEVAIDWAVKD